MALLDIGNAWAADSSTDLFKRFLGACLKAAADIKNESGSAENHANRLIWANGMMSQDSVSVLVRVTQVIRNGAATNATMQANPNALDDSAVEFIVAGAINTFATGS